MKTTSLWIIRIALTVQFLGVLAVPTLLAASESPRAMWIAEWVNPNQGLALSEGRTSRSEVRAESNGRTIGVLRIRDGKLSFVEQLGQIDWELELANVKKVATTSRSLLIVSLTGEQYVLSIMEANMMQTSPKKAASLIERALESVATNNR
jgi:hypothetical protein